MGKSQHEAKKIGLVNGGTVIGIITAVVGVAFSLFHLWTGGVQLLPAYYQRIVHLAFGLVLTFLVFPYAKGKARSPLMWVIDIGMAIAAVVVSVYVGSIFVEQALSQSSPDRLDIFIGILTIALVLEATRRTVGNALPIIAIAALLYAYLGPYLPGIIAHRGFGIQRIIGYLYLTMDGIYGTILGVSATFVYLFVLFGAFLNVAGGSSLFIDLSSSLLGHVRGGFAKVAVFASALFGSISGSPVANVVSTGTFTIPMMKKGGFPAHLAGAVEAVASTGGQIMPPVMGAAAFIIAEIVGIGYVQVMKYALIPAILYFLAVYIMVDLRSAKLGLVGVPRDQLPSLSYVLKKQGLMLIPLIVLVILMVLVQTSPMKAAFWAIVSTCILGAVKREDRLNVHDIIGALQNGAKQALLVVSLTACAGIVVGVVSLTGIGLRLSGILIDLAGGNLFVLMLLTMIACVILGMGLPTTAAYIILAVLAAPAMIEVGVEPIAAHMFVFYFGSLAVITPPVAAASFAAAGIAEASPVKTGFTALGLALAGFILPFMFAYQPALLMIGSDLVILRALITAVAGIFMLGVGIEGYLSGPVRIWQRVFLLPASLLLIDPRPSTDMVGVTLGIIGLLPSLIEWLKKRRLEKNQGVSLRTERS